MVCEAMLPDAVDGVLTEAEQRAFERHLAGCVDCAREFEEAQRGAAWLGLLKKQVPEPGAALLERILAQTSGLDAATVPAPCRAANFQVAAAVPPLLTDSSIGVIHPVPADIPGGRLPVRTIPSWRTAWTSLRAAFSLGTVFQPRMAMTAAMLFFSVALTTNLTGVKLSEIRAAALNPSGLRRSLADRGSEAVRSFQNSSLVYQMESKVSDIRGDWTAGAEQGSPDDQPSAGHSGEQGSGSNSEAPKSEKPFGSSRIQRVPGAGQLRSEREGV